MRLQSDLSVPRQLMSRCPACFFNFKAFLCDLTCNPNQSDFLLVTSEQDYTKQHVADEIEEQDELPEKENDNPTESAQVSSSDLNEPQETGILKREKRNTQQEPSINDSISAKPKKEIVSFTYYLSNDYAQNLYSSCE